MKKTLIILATVLVAAIAAYAIIFAINSTQPSEPDPIIQETPTSPVQPSATPLPTIALDKTTLSIEILNGSGIAGLAGKAKTQLESIGYTNIKTGNAEAFDSTQTEIQISETLRGMESMITDDIASFYQVNPTVSYLPESSDYDIIITLGSESNESEASADDSDDTPLKTIVEEDETEATPEPTTRE